MLPYLRKAAAPIAGLLVISASALLGSVAIDPVTTVKDTLSKLWEYQSNHASEHGWSFGFRLPEAVLNQYIKYLISSHTRVGALDAEVKLKGSGMVDVTCNLDLSRIRQWSPELFQSTALASRQSLRVSATALVTVQGRVADVKFTSLSSEDSAVDGPMVNRLLDSLAANQPEHFNLKGPIRLPFTLIGADVGKGVFSAQTQ